MVLAQKQTHRPMEQNRDPRNNGQLIYDKGGRNTPWGKDTLFNKWSQENQTSTYKRIKLEYLLTLHIKITLKWIKEQNVILETIKIQE